MGENYPSKSCEIPRRCNEIATSEKQDNKEVLREEIQKEKRLMANIGYLTTLQQLWDASELDNLFDGQVVLGEEELLATYGLLDILNGNTSFQALRPPLKMSYERNFALDTSFDISYEALKNEETGKTEAHLASIHGTQNLTPSAFGDTNIKFHYDKKSRKIDSAIFERPILWFDEKIHIHRNSQWLVDKIEVGNMAKVDNTITIEYENGRPFSMKQTKYGAFDDTTYFSHDEKGNLDAILYAPAISVKSLKWAWKAKTLKQAGVVTGQILLWALKRTKWVDTVEIANIDGAPISTKAHLSASNWFITDGKSQFEWKDGYLKKIKLEMNDFPINDKKDITLEY